MDAKPEKRKKSKKTKAKNNIDFVIMTSEGDVKEVVRKKKKKKEKKEKPEAASEPAAAAPAEAEVPKKRKGETPDERAARKAAKKARKEAEAEAAPAPAAPRTLAALPDNPQGVTRLFVGNLPWSITDEGLAEALGVGGLTAVKCRYITDKVSGKFYGSAFVELGDAALAAAAVKKAGDLVGGRPVKVTFAPPRPGDVWPPAAGDSGGRQKKTVVREKAPRPADGTTKLFIGNVAYEANDGDVEALFKAVAPDGLRDMRWVTHKDSGDFKGCGYLSFYEPAQADAAMEQLDGADLCGRPIRLDYTS